MIIGLILLIILLSSVKPEIFLAALAICVVVVAAVTLLSMSGISIQWQEVVSTVPVIVISK